MRRRPPIETNLTWQQARTILHAGEAQGRPLTPAQRRFFAAIVSQKAPKGLTAAQVRAKAKAWAKRAGEPWKGNPPMRENPHDGLTLAQARKLLPRYDLADIVRATRPRDRDKLLAEAAHRERAWIKENPARYEVQAGGQSTLWTDDEEEARQEARWLKESGSDEVYVIDRASGSAKKRSNPARRKNRPLGHQQGGMRGSIPYDEAVASGLTKVPGFKKALAAYRRFHGADPDSVTVMEYPGEGQKVVVRMGEVPETHYLGPDNSVKKGAHWVHKHREKGKGKNPDLLFDPETGLMTIAGGTFKVTRWIYH